MNNRLENISAILLGLMMIIFGLNKFLGFIAVEPPADPTAQQFMGAMFSSYLYVVVGFAEIIGGILLLLPRFRFVGWLLQGTIIFNIAAFHMAHDFIGNGIWLIPTLLFVLLGYFQSSNISALITTKNLRSITPVFLLLLSFSATAQSGNYISSKVENVVIVDKSAKQVWTLISNAENLSSLVPKVIKKVEANGSGVYTSWVIYLQSGLWVKEEMTYFNEEEKELAYVMTKTPMPLSDYWAVQKVDKVDDEKSRVTFVTYYNTTLENKEQLDTTFNNFQITFLNNIETHLK